MYKVPFGVRYFCHWKKGTGEQIPVNSTDKVLSLIGKYNTLEGCGISICTFIAENPILLYMPFDFDSDTLLYSFLDAQRLYNYLAEMGFDCWLQYSGNRGFHVILSVVPKVYTSEQLWKANTHFKELLGLDTVDENLFTDIRRIIRIGGTHHPKSGLLCEKIAENKGRLFDLDNYFPDDGLDLDFEGDGDSLEDYEFNINHEYPCIMNLINNGKYWRKQIGSYEPPQYIRFAYVAIRMWEGKDKKEIFEECKTFDWDDWDARYTRKQINQIFRKRYIPPSCETLRKKGYCTGCKLSEWRPENIV